MSATEIVMEYRRKLASLTPRNKRIWDLAHKMMNEMMSSENAAIQNCWKSSERHHAESRKAEDELLELLTAPPVDEPAPSPPPSQKASWGFSGNMVVVPGCSICGGEGHPDAICPNAPPSPQGESK